MKKLLSLLVVVLSMTASVSLAQDALQRVPVFTMGESNSQYYRIPALVETTGNTLVAIADQRGSALGDLPNIISIVAKTSTDGGKTWGEMVTIAQGNSTAGTTYGDAAAVYDSKTGKIITVFVGNENYGTNCVGLWASNSTYPLRLYQSESSDNGKTWTTPKDISESIYNAIYGSKNSWIGMFAGSGSAVQLKKGEKAGRLMFVVAARNNSTWGGAMSNYAVYSDDNGVTWQVSSNAACTTGDEAKIVELENGDLLMSIKNRADDSSNGKGYRLMAKSTDQGATWTTATVNNNLNDPGCNGEVVSYETADGKYYLIHSMPGSTSIRENVTVYLSSDGGQTWPISRQVYNGYSAYSALEVLDDGTIGIIVEEGKWDGNLPGTDGFNLAYYNFTFDWLMESANVDVTELVQTANALLEKEGIGYPAAAPRAELQAAVKAAEENPSAETSVALQSAIEAYYATNELTMPEAGKVYNLISRSKSGNNYMYNKNGTLSLAAYTNGATLPETANFTCDYIEAENKYTFKTSDGAYYLAYPTIGGKSWLDNESLTGLEATLANVSKFEIAKLTIDVNVAATKEDLFGLVHLWGYRGYDNGKKVDMYGPVVVKSDRNFDGAGGDFYNDSFSTAFTILPVGETVEPEGGNPGGGEVVEPEGGEVVVPSSEGIIIDRSNWSVKASTEEPNEGTYGGYARLAIDNNKASFWHTQWQNAKPTVPHWIQFDMAETYDIASFKYVSRTAKTNDSNGNVKKYKLYISNNDISANINASTKVPVGVEPAYEGEFTYNGTTNEHMVTLPKVVTGRYVYMLINDTYNTDVNTKFANCAEFYVYRNGVATKYAVTTTVSTEGYGTATVNNAASAEVDEGAFVTLKAVANTGYEFISWTKNGELVSHEASVEVPVTEDAEYVANFAEIVNETEYTTISGTHNRDDRRLASFEISNGVEKISVKGVGVGSSAYVNRSKSSILNVQAGDVITFPAFNWVGQWMHAYAYVDYDNNKLFNTTSNNDGSTSGELVTYNYFGGTDINGNTANQQFACTESYTNSYGTSNGLPAFKLPDTMEPGDYRLRITVAWNSLSPDGYNEIIDNGGVLLDMTLRVAASDKYYVKVATSSNNGKVYIETEGVTTKFVANDGEQTVVLTAEANADYAFANWTLDGEVVSTDAVYTTDAITENREYVANFVYAGKCYLSSDIADGEGTIVFQDEAGNAIEETKVVIGTKVRIVVTPAESYYLDGVYYNDEEMEIEDPASWVLDVVVEDDIMVEAYFEKSEDTAIEDTLVDAAQVRVAGQSIIVNGYAGAVRVVNVCGQVVANVASNGKAEINVARGIYLVVTGSQVNKVVVK